MQTPIGSIKRRRIRRRVVNYAFPNVQRAFSARDLISRFNSSRYRPSRPLGAPGLNGRSLFSGDRAAFARLSDRFVSDDNENDSINVRG